MHRRRTVNKLGYLGVLLLACGLLPGCVASRNLQRTTVSGLQTAGAGTMKVGRAIGRGSVWAGKKVAAGTKQVAHAGAGAVRSVSSKPRDPAPGGLDLGPPTPIDDDPAALAAKPAAATSTTAKGEAPARTVARVGDGKGRNAHPAANNNDEDAVREESPTAIARADANDDDATDDEAGRPGDVVLASNRGSRDDDPPAKMIDEGDGIQYDLPTLDLDRMLAHGEARQAARASASTRTSSRSGRSTPAP